MHWLKMNTSILSPVAGVRKKKQGSVTQEQTDDDFDRVHEMENIQLREENMNDLAQIMMMRMMNEFGAAGN